MARRKRAGENPEDDDYEGVPDGAWGGSRKPADEPTQLMEVESDPERATRLLEGLGPRLACRLTPRWLLRLLSARSTPRAAKVAALIDALHAMPAAIPDCSPARMRALDRQAVRVAATRLAAAPPAPDAPIDPDLLQAARRSLHRIDPADLADSDLPEVRELALVVGEHGLALSSSGWVTMSTSVGPSWARASAITASSIAGSSTRHDFTPKAAARTDAPRGPSPSSNGAPTCSVAAPSGRSVRSLASQRTTPSTTSASWTSSLVPPSRTVGAGAPSGVSTTTCTAKGPRMDAWKKTASYASSSCAATNTGATRTPPAWPPSPRASRCSTTSLETSACTPVGSAVVRAAGAGRWR